jgi:capsular polysaccharide export protein
MISEGLGAFKGRRVLLLQGPLGPFFRRLANELNEAGATVKKINFNGGDFAFYPFNAENFRGDASQWPRYLEQYLKKENIDLVLLFGDCRDLHQAAHEIATRHNIDVGVFEEGYVRPDHVTLELYGVNGHSQISRDANFYLAPEQTISSVQSYQVGNTFRFAAMWAMMYYTASTLFKPFFSKYKHHRPLGILEGLPWVRGAWRKYKYAIKERHVQKQLTGERSKHYYLVPLQVYNDAQVQVHSDFDSIKLFISEVMTSFAENSPKDTYLVIKQHPMDRAYRDYALYISRLAEKFSIADRVQYIHDQHLPSLLEHARGVVVINSTVGLSALHHGAPLKVCGNAIYDMAGLTYQGQLNDFWHDAQHYYINEALYLNYLNYLIRNTQLNGSFYRRLKLTHSSTGLVWNDIDPKTAQNLVPAATPSFKTEPMKIKSAPLVSRAVSEK